MRPIILGGLPRMDNVDLWLLLLPHNLVVRGTHRLDVDRSDANEEEAVPPLPRDEIITALMTDAAESHSKQRDSWATRKRVQTQPLISPAPRLSFQFLVFTQVCDVLAKEGIALARNRVVDTQTSKQLCLHHRHNQRLSK